MINPDICHEILVKNTKQILAFDKSANFEEYRLQVPKLKALCLRN